MYVREKREEKRRERGGGEKERERKRERGGGEKRERVEYNLTAVVAVEC